MMQLEGRLKGVADRDKWRARGASFEGGLKGVADREKWRARGVSFVGKLKATKLVWFPPEPAKSGRAAGTAAKKTTKRAATKSNGAAKRSARSTKKVTQPARAKKA